MSFLRKYMRKAKNEWNSYSEVQVWVRDATSNDPWGPSSSLMARIAREADSPANYHMMFTTLWKRLVDYQHLRHVLKSLTLIEYLLRHCHERFVSDVRLRADVIRRLKHYKFFEDGRDIGAEVRSKATTIMQLLEDKDKLADARRVARETEGKIRGYSHEYSGFYGQDGIDNEGLDRDPFGNVQDDQLRIEYRRDDSQPRHSSEPEGDEMKSDSEVDEVEEEVSKKKVSSAKKSKKGKKKRSKKAASKRRESEEPERVEKEDAQEDAENHEPPTYQGGKKDFFESDEEDVAPKQDETDAFFSTIASAPKPMLFETDLVTGGHNSAAAAQFGWLGASAPLPTTSSDDGALFDTPIVTKDSAPAPTEGAFFDFTSDFSSKVSISEPEGKKEQAPIDPWDLAKDISVLDNLTVTSDERKIKQNLESRRERERNGPKLKELVKQSKEKRDNMNPFDALVQAPAPEIPSTPFVGQHSMALVPAGQFYDPSQAQALVPVNPYAPYGYPMGPQPMYGYDPYGYPPRY